MATESSKTKILAGMVAVSFIVVVFLYMEVQEKKGELNESSIDFNVVKEGDVVEIDYIGRYLNGTVFDTSKENIAIQEGIYNRLRNYTPLVFSIGYNEIIAGVEEAVKSMKVGEQKTIKVPPEQGYGYWSEENVDEINRVQVLPRVEEIPRDFYEQTVEKPPVVNDILDMAETPWEIRIVDVSEDSVFIIHNPENGTLLPTLFGNSSIRADEENIYSILEVEEGESIYSSIGQLRVLEVTDTTVRIDANHPLVGQMLEFNLELVSINKVEDPFRDQTVF